MLLAKYLPSRISYIFFAKVSVMTWYLISYVKKDLMTPHATIFILSQSFVEVFWG